MSLIYSTLDNRHQIRQSIRQREITEASQRITSGNRLSTNNNKDSGALRISSRLKSLTNIGGITKRNLDNAYHLIQYQSDILHYAENTISRMNEIAYQATDIMLSKSERRNLDEEFQSHIETLKDILYDRTFGKVMFDPLASKNIESLSIEGQSGGPTTSIKEIENFGSLGGKIQLWWQPYTARDRIQIFQGDRWFFDSGEYMSAHDINQNGYYDMPGVEYRAFDGTRKEDGSPVFGDKFEIDFQPNQISVTTDPGNIGNSEEFLVLSDSNQDGFGDTYIRTESLSGYPKFREPIGDTSKLKFIVNGSGQENVLRQRGTVWDYFLKIDKNYITGPKGIKNELGELMQFDTVGFSTLEGLSVKNRLDATTAQSKTKDELDSISSQISTLAKSFSELRFRSDRAEIKTTSSHIALGKITDTNMAQEATDLAKNLLVQGMSNKAIVHSKISAKNVFELLI